jgi:G8 domain
MMHVQTGTNNHGSNRTHTSRNLTSRDAAILPSPPVPNATILPMICPHEGPGLKRWHANSTWGGFLPAAGRNVVIPVSSRVIVDQDIVQRLGVVTVPASSELIIGSNPLGVRINATGFVVYGKLTAGSESCRISNPITITLHGRRPTNASMNIPSLSLKGILVSGLNSALSLHGERFYPTWTRLAASVAIGQRELRLQEKVNIAISCYYAINLFFAPLNLW